MSTKHIEALKLALEGAANYIDALGGDSCKYRQALAEQPAQQEPVAFLANGTRFKISYDSRQSGGQIHGIQPELGGRWVAFVAADDDCHLKLTSPPARKPLTDDQWQVIANTLHCCISRGQKDTIEAALGIKEST